ncbi:Glyco-hydro-79C domain-containing protein [Mycena chlorophos]|uniref:Glyco-hydro-79C domain-containing protein n=1 Tax=Mycena chlorophos TaxID=658473 RepID=A0A8H6T419_MYCCL|nr:Glyco-hydro-79C domain-containing protein [Mycena chlorophos]
MISLIPFCLLLLQSSYSANAAYPVSVPSTASSSLTVPSNFLGISFELTFIADYFGNNTQQINTPMLNYMAAIRVRTDQSDSVRVRIGGNSADSSPYTSPAESPMAALQSGTYNDNDQDCNYNSMLWQVMSDVSKSVGGVSYVVNVPLAIAPNASLANDMRNILGADLDAMLLGNEPDLYSGHGKRPNLANYTVQDYINDYTSALATIGTKDAEGKADIGGPSVCCNWDLATLLQQNYLSTFASDLKYIVLQHYGTYPYQLPWYTAHANVVSLTQWQSNGIEYLLSQPASSRPQLINSEFNSASCGGVPFSPSFGVGSIWSIDYALQMASVGYTQAYIHTREAGISYNIVKPPAGPAGSAGSWATNAPYYSLLVTAEALSTGDGAIVQDLNLAGSSTTTNVTTSGYAIYHASNKTLSRLVLINAANGSSTDFALPASVFQSSGTALVKFLSAATLDEETNISWGGETWSGADVTDGKSTQTPSWATPNQKLSGCSQNGCTFTAPGPSLSVVFLDDSQNRVIAAVNPTNPSTLSNQSSNLSSSTSSNVSNSPTGHS